MHILHLLKFIPTSSTFIARKLGKFDKTQQLKLDGIISFQVMPGKYCVGSFKQRCFRKIEKGFQCDVCFKSSQYNYCAACTGEKCLLRRKICGPHIVYLACFANVLKVGVCSEERFPTRVIEQGADYALALAKTSDGLEARKLERQIRDKFNITDRLSNLFKQKGLLKEEAAKLGEQFLKTTYFDVVDTLPAKTKQDIDILDLSENYATIKDEVTPLEIKDHRHVYGRIIGTKGNFLFLKQNEKVFLINGYSLVSRVIKI